MTGERDFLVGKRVTVIGLGIEGVDVARFAATHGAAAVTVVDAKPRESLSARIEQLGDLDIALALGPDATVDPASFDYLFASQSVPLAHPALVDAAHRGIPIDSMTACFLRLCPGPTVGISGSSGKTTTTALTHHILSAAGVASIAGGNIGSGLLAQLDALDSNTWAVMEISHTQLQLTDRSPHVAVLLNVTPNHLDQFAWDEYVDLKYRLVRFQGERDIAVLNRDDPVAAGAAEHTRAQVWHLSAAGDVPGDGAFVRDGAIFVRNGPIEEMVLPVHEIPLRGAHNVANVLAAAAVAAIAGVSPQATAEAVRSFAPVPHRLEVAGEVNGVRYVNDSIATTPERALAAIRSFSEPIVLLLGGRDKDLPKEELAEEALRRCTGIVFFGADGPLFEAAVEAAAGSVAYEERPILVRVATLDEAVRQAHDIAAPGDVVLLSPACTSFDGFANFEERGTAFRRIVADMSRRGA